MMPILAGFLLLLGGCTMASGLLASASVAGVEYTMANVAHKVLPEANLQVREAVDRALARMRFPVERGWRKDEEGLVILARSGRYGLEVRLEEISSRATRLRVDARRAAFPLFKDKALAAALITETERELGMPR